MSRPLLYHRQPTNKTCGQTVLAMIMGNDPEFVIENMGGNQTAANKLRTVLGLFGYKTTNTRRFLKRWYTNTDHTGDAAVVYMKQGVNEHGRKWKHWVLYYKGKVYDPGLGYACSWETYVKKNMKNGARFTSYFQVEIEGLEP